MVPPDVAQERGPDDPGPNTEGQQEPGHTPGDGHCPIIPGTVISDSSGAGGLSRASPVVGCEPVEHHWIVRRDDGGAASCADRRQPGVVAADPGPVLADGP